MNHQNYGMLIAAIGGVMILIGLIVWLGGFSWFGHLPGDIRIEKPATRIYFPFTSMLLISIALNLVLYIVRKFF